MVKVSLFFFLILLGFFGSWSPLIPFPAYKIIVLTAGSALLFYLVSLVKSEQAGQKLIRLTTLSTLFLLFLFWSALGYLYSADPEKSLLLTVQSLCAILVYLGLTLYIQKESQTEAILQTLLSFGGAIAFIGIIQQFPLSFLDNPIFNGNNATSLFVHKNVFAGYLVLLIPLSCLIYLSNYSKLWKGIAGISFVLYLTALMFSGSRGGQLVGILELLAIMGYLIFNTARKEVMSLVTGVAVSVALYLMIDLIVKGLGVQPNRTSLLGLMELAKIDTADAGLAQSLNRVLFWQGAWEIFKDHWLIGSGPLSFAMLFPKYYLTFTPIINGHYLTSGAPPHAHNLFLQTASDSGLIGIGLLLAFLVIFYFQVYQLFSHSSLKIRSTLFFLTLAVTSFLFHQMVEYNWPGSMFIFNFTIFIFLIDFIKRKHFSLKKVSPPGKIFYVVPAAGIFIFFLTVASSIQYYKYHSAVESFSKSRSMHELVSLTAQAKKICPRCYKPYLWLADDLLLRYKINPDKNFIRLAKNELLKGRKLNPYNPHFNVYLSQILTIQGDYKQALRSLKDALKFNKTHKFNIAKLGLSVTQLRSMDQAESHRR
jgi:O-antigen ligase